MWLYFCSAAYAQSSFRGSNLEDHMLIKIMDEGINGKLRLDIEGSPYLNEEWVDGEIHTFKASYAGVSMRYNIYLDYIEFKQKGKSYILDPEPRLRKIELDGNTLVVAKYGRIGKMKDGYFLLLDSGKLQLMSKKAIQFKEAQAPKALESSATPAKYQQLPDQFFYRFGQGDLVKISNTRKMIAGLQDHQEELNAFAKKEKISAKKEDDLIRLVKYYNSL